MPLFLWMTYAKTHLDNIGELLYNYTVRKVK
jgi:hypothetical protein